MSSSRYCQVYPQNVKSAGYTEYDQIDFVLSGAGQKLVANTVTLCADVVVSGTTVATQVYINNLVGGHGFISSIAVSTVNQGQLEYIAEYNRLVSAVSNASLNSSLDTFNSNLTCELRTCDPHVSGALLYGLFSKDQVDEPLFKTNPDMSLKLHCCLNNVIGDPLLPFAKTGDVTVTLQLERVINALYGYPTIGAGISYTLQNVRLNYITTPDDGVYSKNYTFNVYSSIRQSIQSSYSNVTTKAPVVANSVFCTFIQQANESNPMTDNLLQEYLPLVSSVQFLWNGNFSQSVVYTLDNVQDILQNYLEAISGSVTVNNASLQCLAQNKSYGVGLKFNQPVNLAQNSFTLNLTSAIDGSSPYTINMFFNGVLNI